LLEMNGPDTAVIEVPTVTPVDVTGIIEPTL